MGQINVGRVVMGGVGAAIILFLAGGVIHGAILGSDWQAWLDAGHLPLAPSHATGMAMWVIVALVNGLVGVWIYAGIRPRYGAGPKTAALAGLMLWFVAWLGPALGQFALGNTPYRVIVIGTVAGLVAVVVAIIAGAFVYKEQ